MALSLRYAYLILIAAMAGTLLLAAVGLSELQPPPQDFSDHLGVSKADNLTYYTEQLPPYSFQDNGSLSGISIDLLELVTERMGTEVSREDVHLVPWTEGYQAALTRNGTVLFSMARTPDREQSFKWAGPIYTDCEVLFSRRDRGISIQSPEDLQGYRIGVIADDIAIEQLLDIGVEPDQIVPESAASVLMAKLESGEIDLWACPEAAGRYFAEQLTGNYYYYDVVFRLQPRDLYFAFSRDVPDSTVQSFQEAIDGVKEEKDASGISSYQRILGKYDPRIGLEHLNYLTEEWAPFNYRENEVTGISVEILEAVFRHLGVNRSREEVRIVPLAEGFEAARNETGTVLFSIVRTPEREPQFKWAGPFTRAGFVLFAPRSRNITISAPEDLNRYRIGAVQDSIENDLLISQGVSRSDLVSGKTPADLLQMLEEGSIDLWATGDLAGRHQMKQTAKDPDGYEVVYSLSENDFYFIFSRDVPDTLVRAFQHALEAVREEEDAQGVSDYERIIYKYLGAGCSRQTFSDQAVTDLVNSTASALGENASDTLRAINAGWPPYRDPANPGLYAFVFTDNLTMAAHGENIQLVGTNYRGKTDAAGKPFIDQILEGALKNGTGWVDYIYMHPTQPNLYYKTTYYQLMQGSDGQRYIVCSGNYRRCE